MMYDWDFLILFGVIIIGIIVYAGNKKIKGKKNSKAMDIIDERYAKGEITKEEYMELQKTININKEK